MFGYHTLGYILYYYDYITICIFCVDIFLGLSANISRYFLVKMPRSAGPQAAKEPPAWNGGRLWETSGSALRLCGGGLSDILGGIVGDVVKLLVAADIDVQRRLSEEDIIQEGSSEWHSSGRR